MRRWTLLAFFALLAVVLAVLAWAPGSGALAAPAVLAPSAALAFSSPQVRKVAAHRRPITFKQFRAFVLRDIARQQNEVAEKLQAPGLTPAEKARLTRKKARLDRLTALPEARRDKFLHRRFNEIDTDHDGTIDRQERAAWRAKREARASERAERAPAAQP